MTPTQPNFIWLLDTIPPGKHKEEAESVFPTLQLVEIFDSGLFLIFLNVFSKPQAKPPARYPVAPHGHLHAPGIVMLLTLLYSNIKQALDFVNIVLKFCHFYYC